MKAKTTVLEKPCMMSENSRILMARSQKVVALMRNDKTLATMPPMRPTKTEMVVRSGRVMRAARTRGVTSLRLGSVPMARMASTCSVTSMEPSSEAMPEEQRPATKACDGRAEFANESEGDDVSG